MAYSVGGKKFDNLSLAQIESTKLRGLNQPGLDFGISTVPDEATWVASGGTYGMPQNNYGGNTGNGSGGAFGGGNTQSSGANRFEGMLSDAEGRLKRLLDDPNSVQQTAGYQFRVNQGQEALQRSLGARGMLNSGNRLMDLTKYGQDMASQEYDNQFGRLKDLLGTGTTGYIGDRGASNQAQDISNRFKLGSDMNELARAQFDAKQPVRSSGIANPWALPGYNGYNF